MHTLPGECHSLQLCTKYATRWLWQLWGYGVYPGDPYNVRENNMGIWKAETFTYLSLVFWFWTLATPMRALSSRRAVSAMGPNEALALATNQLKQMNLMKSNRNTSGEWRAQGKTRGWRMFLDIFGVHLALGIRLYIICIYIYVLVLVGSCWHFLAAWFPPLSKPWGSKRWNYSLKVCPRPASATPKMGPAPPAEWCASYGQAPRGRWRPGRLGLTGRDLQSKRWLKLAAGMSQMSP